ncbi:unnamed protein product [Lasius platythorax]|uniref:RanBD1 domain-containing protein n=1 Tax=Lasius platythorax TaxID=488582 RepID=A0AAV2NAZ9_9HYME
MPLLYKIEVKIDEKNEEVLYSHRTKLFRFDTAMEWKKCELGDIKLPRYKKIGKLLFMRRNHTFNLCLNHYLSGELRAEGRKNVAVKHWQTIGTARSSTCNLLGPSSHPRS